MDRFESLESFVTVVESGQFSAAAERLGIGKSVISRRVSELEEYLGALLIQRTTRRLSLTDAGRAFYPRAIQLLEDLAEAEQSVSTAQHALSGRIRLAAPLSFGLMHLAPALNSFMTQHPGVMLDMDFNDSQVDLIQQGFDLALRIGRLEDSTMVALPLAPIHTVVCASPGYLARYGTPKTPQALSDHHCLCYSNLPEPQKWRFIDNAGGKQSVRVENRMLANNGQIILEAAASGHGICISPTFIAYRTILEGRLVPILRDYKIPEATAYAVYPNRRFIPQRVRVLTEYFRELFGERPYWDEGLF
ncbi:MAG: LysR family transcriptional regulator [Candidatus Thiodiazotropha sp.]